MQNVPKPHADLPRVPLAIDYAKTAEGRQLIQAGIHDVTAINRIYVLPPETPKELVETMQNAFMDTMKDRKFRADAEKSKLEIDPIPGEEVEKIVSGFFKLNAATVAKLKEVVK